MRSQDYPYGIVYKKYYHTTLDQNQVSVSYTHLPEVAPEVKEDDIVDITVACSNEGDYKSSPFKEEKPVEKQPEACLLYTS